MRAKATCGHCGREFLFFQLYNASPLDADRCPHCGRHLGVLRLSSAARRVDAAAAELVRALRELAARNPEFRLDPDSILSPISEAISPMRAAGDRDQSPSMERAA